MMRRTLLAVTLLAAAAAGCGSQAPRGIAAPPASAGTPAQAAARHGGASLGLLAPVYAPLAEQIVEDFRLAAVEGVGIDLGSGPGTLIVELAKRTRMHWINADINPACFPPFFRLVDAAGLGGRASVCCGAEA